MAERRRQNETLTRHELARRLAAEVGSVSGAERFLKEMFEALGDELAARGLVKIHGLGVFECLQKRARPGRNPRTGEAARIAPRRVASFVGGVKLKRLVATGGVDGDEADDDDDAE